MKADSKDLEFEEYKRQIENCPNCKKREQLIKDMIKERRF